MKPILIVKTGGTYPDMAARFGDFEDWFVERMDRSSAAIETVSPFCGEALPPAASFGGIVITGSHDMVTDKHPWSEQTAGWVKHAVGRRDPASGRLLRGINCWHMPWVAWWVTPPEGRSSGRCRSG